MNLASANPALDARLRAMPPHLRAGLPMVRQGQRGRDLGVDHDSHFRLYRRRVTGNRILIEDVLRAVERTTGVSPLDMIAGRGSREVSTARQLTMFILTHHLHRRVEVVGKSMARHHTVVIRGRRAIGRRLAHSADFRALLTCTLTVLGLNADAA